MWPDMSHYSRFPQFPTDVLNNSAHVGKGDMSLGLVVPGFLGMRDDLLIPLGLSI